MLLQHNASHVMFLGFYGRGALSGKFESKYLPWRRIKLHCPLNATYEKRQRNKSRIFFLHCKFVSKGKVFKTYYAHNILYGESYKI